MGIVNQNNNLYLNVSCGKLVNKKKEISSMAYEGLLLGIERKDDEYEGKIVGKITCKLKDTKSDEICFITWTEESYYSVGFFARITKANLSQPILIGVSGSKENEKISFCWMKQGQETIKVEKGEFPGPKKVKVGKKEMVDWTKPLELFEKIMNQVNESLGKVDHTAFASTPETDLPKDDLPF